MILGSPILVARSISLYDSLGEYAPKCNLFVQGVELPNFKECRCSAAQVPRSRRMRPSSGRFLVDLEPEQEEHERTVASVKAAETVVANGLSVGGGARLHKILDRHWNAFRCGFCGDPPARVEPLSMTFKPEEKVVKARGRVYPPIKMA